MHDNDAKLLNLIALRDQLTLKRLFDRLGLYLNSVGFYVTHH